MNVNGEEFTLSDFKLQYISKSTIATNLWKPFSIANLLVSQRRKRCSATPAWPRWWNAAELLGRPAPNIDRLTWQKFVVGIWILHGFHMEFHMDIMGIPYLEWLDAPLPFQKWINKYSESDLFRCLQPNYKSPGFWHCPHGTSCKVDDPPKCHVLWCMAHLWSKK